MYGYGNHLSGWGWAAMSFGMIVFWGLVITGIVLLVRSLRPAGKRSAGADGPRTPEHVLDMRFARGDIDEAEYHARLDVLHRASGDDPLTTSGSRRSTGKS